MRAYEQGLGITVTYTTDRRPTAHLLEYLFKLGAEGRVGYIMYLALKTELAVVRRKSRAARSQMRMIVRAEEYVRKTFLS
jgi:hypothetical protein